MQHRILFFFRIKLLEKVKLSIHGVQLTAVKGKRVRVPRTGLTVWHGTVSGLWLGAVAAVCLICRLRCSTQSCRSCWFVHTTWSRSNIGPAGNRTR